MDDTIRVVLEDAFPDREVVDITEAPNSDRRGNTTVRVKFIDGDRVFLKLRVDGDAARNQRETAATQYARAHCGVRVPEVMAADSTASPPYLATTSLNGTAASTAWESPEHRTAVARDIGRAVAGITEARFDAHGWITGGDQEQLSCETNHWSLVLANAIERQAAEVPYPDRFADVPVRVAALLRRGSDILDGAMPALLHQDIRPENVLQNGQPGVIDWEWVLVGDPGLGLYWGRHEWPNVQLSLPVTGTGSVGQSVTGFASMLATCRKATSGDDRSTGL